MRHFQNWVCAVANVMNCEDALTHCENCRT
jgi:hypothetical protein